jgi:hypothetical protein
MFVCNSCDYTTKTKYNYDRHLKSSKHLKNVKISEILNYSSETILNASQKNDENKKCADCGKQFKHYSSYHRHCKYRCDTKYDTDDDNDDNDDNDDKDKDDLIELKHQLELLKQRIEFQNAISNLEKQNVELERDLTVHGLQDKIEYLEQNQKLIVANNTPKLTQQNTVNISNPSIITKQNNLNVYFGEMIDFDTFIENYKTKFSLTYDETKVLLENYHHSGIKSYGNGLFSILKKNCAKQLSELIGEDVDTPILPFVLSDSGLRNHLEKTPGGWIPASTRDKIKKLVVISNDQIYKHHNDCIPMSAYEKELVTNSILRKSDYHYAQLAIQKRGALEPQNCLRKL